LNLGTFVSGVFLLNLGLWHIWHNWIAPAHSDLDAFDMDFYVPIFPLVILVVPIQSEYPIVTTIHLKVIMRYM
jgi:hypothetical protein